MTKEQLIERAYFVSGGSLKNLTTEKIMELITVTQYVTDICINELEERKEIGFLDGMPIIPYECEHSVETILTRQD